MAYRGVPDSVDRERRQQSYVGARTIEARFPSSGTFAIELRFVDPDGVLTPSPFRQIYAPGMQAYFDLRCPLHDCTDGGFDIDRQVTAMLANPSVKRVGSATCSGSRPGTNGRQRCGLQLSFALTATD
jgi:hypothetical protein